LKKIIKVLLSRMAVIIFLMSVQIAAVVLLTLKLSKSYFYFYSFLEFLSILVVFYIASRDTNPSRKIIWIILILIFPIFGGILFILLKTSSANKKFSKSIHESNNQTLSHLDTDNGVLESLKNHGGSIVAQSRYIANSGFPVYKNTTTRYFNSGEEFFVSLIEELKKAEKFIFIEFFIIHEGLMWNTILSVLEEKAKEGVDVRVMYDDAGCLTRLPYKYYETLGKKGIKCFVFNPFTPVIEVRMNHRDHRKIIVIDGYVGYTGGINLSDEYINAREKFGYWKDAAILIKGEAVWNMTIMFLQLWSYISKTVMDNNEDYNKFRPDSRIFGPFESDGYVQPFGDSPIDNEPVGESVYLNMICRAKKYIYIFTPYLIIDHKMINALSLAAKSGVDVRIVTPHIPDKWYVFLVTKSYYPILIEQGVRIYEYTPGFLHSKTVLCDDEIAVVGSINLDYRSLYFHFECGIFLYKTKSIEEIKEDFQKTFPICQEITLDECKKVSFPKRILQTFLKLFAPLM